MQKNFGLYTKHMRWVTHQKQQKWQMVALLSTTSTVDMQISIKFVSWAIFGYFKTIWEWAILGTSCCNVPFGVPSCCNVPFGVPSCSNVQKDHCTWHVMHPISSWSRTTNLESVTPAWHNQWSCTSILQFVHDTQCFYTTNNVNICRCVSVQPLHKIEGNADNTNYCIHRMKRMH